MTRGATATPPTSWTLARAVLSLPLILQIVGGFVPGPLLWGVGHGAYLPWPPWITALWSAAVLAAIWSSVCIRLGDALVDRVEPRLLGRGWVAFGVLPVIGAAVAWFFRDRTHLLGDGTLMASMLAEGRLFHGFDSMAFHLHARLASLAGVGDHPDATALVAVASTVTGMFYLAAAAWSARRLGRQPGERLLLYALLAGAAAWQLFAGYVECYAQLAVCLLLFATTLLQHERGEATLTLPAIWFAAALFWHLNALLLAPLLAAVAIRPPTGPQPRWPRRLWKAVWPALVSVAAVVALATAGGYDGAAFTDEVLTSRPDRQLLTAWSGPRGLIDWRHWKDLANLGLLLAPIPTALLVIALVRRDRRWSPASIRLALGAAWLPVPALLINFKLGMARDWDLLAGHAALAAVAAFAAWTVASRRTRATGPVLALVVLAALGMGAPRLAVHASRSASLRRLPAVVRDLPPYARGLALEDLGRWYRDRDDLAGAAAAYGEGALACPTHGRFHLLHGQSLYQQGEHAAALDPLRRARRLDPEAALPLQMLVLNLVALERNEDALRCARELAGRPGETAAAARTHGMLAEDAGQPEEAVEAYSRAVRRDPRNVDLMLRIGRIELAAGRTARAEYAFRQALQHDRTSIDAHLGLAAALWSRVEAEPRCAGEVVRLLDRVLEAGADDPDLSTWRAVAAARVAP